MCISESENRPSFGTRLQAFVCRLFLLCVFVVTSSLTASANPLDGTVVKGQASITSSAGTVDIIQKSKRAVIDWRSFNIEAGETTNFHQPSASSVTLNRVNTPDPSRINGNLNANGKVILINPNGVFFGQGSKVDVNGLVATTADTNNEQFMKGKMNFNIAGNPNATVSNAGSITAGQAGLVGLVAPNVSNIGTIDAKMGRVTLGSGDTFTMDMYGDGLINVGVSDAVQSQVIQQTGRINAAGGTIQITAGAGRQVVNSLVNVSGELNAPTAGMKNGKIIISGEGSNKTTKTGNSTVIIDGRLDVSGKGKGQTGGTVEITGDYVGLLRDSRIDASGDRGGGTVRVGGDYRGQGATPTAKKVIMQSGATINADATGKGNGGKVTVWADDRTDFAGGISAKGGVKGGNGGFVETSGKEMLVATGNVDASAAEGLAGLWLLDPRNITIQATGPDSNIGGNPNWAATGNNAILTTGSITTALNAGTSVSVSTGATGAQAGNITVADAIAKTAGGNATLTLQAANDINVNAAITSSSGMLNVILNADNDNGTANGAGGIRVISNITSNGGNITMGGGPAPATTAAYGTAGINDAITIDGANINAGGGNISMRGIGYASGATNGWGVWIVNGATVQTSGTGTVTLHGTGGNGTSATEVGVGIDASAVTTASGDITITGIGGASSTGDGSHGFYMLNAANVQTTGGGLITISGTGGGTGTSGSNLGAWVTGGSTITGSGGAVSITGQGGNGSGDYNEGMDIYTSSVISNTGTGTITLTGTGGGSGNNNWGVEVDQSGTVTTANGNIIINGTGGGAGTSSNNYGVHIWNNTGGIVKTTGSGNINITGTGGNAAGSGTDNYGVNLGVTDGVQTTGSGNITITGTGPANTGANNFGVYVSAVDAVHASGTGGITVSSFGGGGYHNHSIVVTSGSITASGGNISITGTGGTGGDSGSVELNDSSISTTGSGTITITGTGGADGDGNFGIGMFGASSISTVDGAISLTGIGGGGSGGDYNYGVFIGDTGSIATTGTGSISVAGTGGGATGTGDYNYGIELIAANGIWAKAGGAITVTGTGGNGSGDGSENVGVNLEGSGGITGTGGTVTVTGTGGAATGNYNGGVEVAGAAVISNTGSGAVTVTGIAGANTAFGGFGVEIDSGGVISAVDGLLTVAGTGGAGSGGADTTTSHWGVVLWNAGSAITTTGAGNIIVTGQGGVNTSGNYNHGVYIADAGSIIAADAGTITVTGTGGNDGGAGSDNTGIRIDGGAISASGGAINLTGTGGLGSYDWNSGLDIGSWSFATPSLVSNTGSGTISITGTGMGDNDASNALGLDLWGGGVISAVNGTITITGTGGGAGGGASNHGVGVAGAGTSVTTSGTGNIAINGAGTDAVFIGAAGTTTYGVNIANDGSITTGSGNITITGTGGYGSGTDNNGVYMDANGLVSSVNGNIAVTGFGGEASAHTWGVQLNGSTISSSGAGNVSVTGTGGGGAGSEGIGVEIWAASMVSTVNGDVTVTGTGGSGAGTSNNYGIWLDEFSTNRIASTGSGNITVTGTGGNTSGDNNIGILLEEDNTIYASGSGNITVTGTGGGTGTGSYGIEVSASSARTPVRSDGAGSITMTSTGANGATDLFFTGSTATIGSGTASGNITFIQDTATWGSARPNTSGTVTFMPRSVNTSVGVAGGAGTLGITSALLNTNGVRRATLVVIGRSDGTGAMNVNARTWTTGNCPLCSALLRTGSGVMTIAGAQAMGSNNLTLQTDSNLVLSAALGGTGTLTIQPSANATTMGLDGAAGTLNISTAELGQLTNGWGSIVMGRTTGTGDITANGFTWNDNLTFQNGSGSISLASGNGTHNLGTNSLTMTTATGGAITVAGATTVGTFSAVATGGGGVSLNAITSSSTIFAQTAGGSGDITLTGNSSATAAGNAIILASSHNFINSAGSSALSAPNAAGRWLVYSTDPAQDTINSLSNDFRRFSCTYGGSCPSFPAPITDQNGFLYTTTPVLTATPNNLTSVTYGDAAPSLTGYAYTLSGYQGADSGADSVTGSLNGSTNYTQGSNAGSVYYLNYASGALASAMGYSITYANNSTALTVGKRVLTTTVQNKSITYGTATPTLDKDSAADVVWGNFYGADNSSSITSATFTYGGATAGGFNNAGSYALGVSGITSTNYTTGAVTNGTLTISPYALSVTANAQSKTYGAADPALTYTNGALQNGDTAAVFSGVLGRAAGENVGAYAIGQGTLSAGGNYTISYTGANLTVTPYTLTVSANARTKAYGAADPALTYTNGALQNGDTAAVFSGALTRAAGENVGAYAIGQGTLSAGSNYTISYTGNNLTITPYTLAVTADAKSKTYGAADPALTYTNGALQNGDTAAVFSGALTRAAGENAGAYAIGQGTLSAGSNYTISYTGANLTINPYTLSVTANAQSKTYGAADPALTYTNGALQNGDTAAVFSGALTRAAGENAGAYAIGQGTLSAGSNYTISYTGANLTINPYTLSVTANAQSKTYGAADPALTYTNGALQNGDTAAVFSGALTRAAGENVGAYAISQGTLSAGSNYTISFTGANLTVTPYTLSVTANAQSKTYGAADPALTYTNGALQNGDTAAVFSGGLTRAAGENVGAYAIGQGTLTAGSNYTISYTGANLTINPYTLSVTANAQSKTYGAADPALTYTNGALQNGDTAAVFSGALTRAVGENVGAYAISQGTLSAGSNYNISFTGANLTVTPYTLSVTANAQGKTYGAADPALTYTNGALQNGDTAAVFSGVLTRAAGENVGAYAIGQGTLSAGSNYTISYTGANLTITPYTLSVTANAQSKTYGAADPALTYTNGALQNGDTAAVFSGALTRAAGENVGAYAIGQGTLSAGSNYTISYTGANLTISPYALSVTANAQSKTYGAADPALTYTNGALQNGDTAAVFSGALTRAAGENAGAYAIGQGTLSAGSNYTISYTSANLTINPYTLSVTANAQGKTYGAADPALTYTNGALQNGDTAAVFSGALTRAAGENVGAYAISQGTLSAGSNYTISFTGANLTVTPYTLSVTANAQGKTYGAADPALTYTNGALQNGDTAAVFSGTQTRVAGENVGAYAISQGTLSAGSNYTISYTGANLTITPHVLSVAADAQSKTYGDVDPALTYTNGALQNGDTAAVFSGALTRVAGETVGAYAINQGTLSAGSNYTISYTGANLTINPAAVVLTITADNASKIYGTAYSFAGTEFSAVGLQGADTVTGVTLTSTGAAASAGVGSYAIVASNAVGSGLSNYTISYVDGTMTVTPYTLSVTANAQGKVYGAADPALTYTFGALQGGDTAGVFSGGLGRAAGENVGAYAINQGTLSAGANYTLSYTGANLTITPYTLSVTANAQSKSYGATDPALTYTNGALQNGDTAAVFTGTLTRAAGENVGAYAIGQGTLAAGSNYTISYTGANLNITPYILSVTANAQSKTYGTADPALTYTNGALQNGDTAAVFSGALTRVAGENVGAYAISQGTVSAGSNYTISFTGANLNITPYILAVTADAQGKTYGAADPALTYTNGALQNGDTAAVFTGALSRAAGENVGAYAIGQGTLSAGANYTISYTGANLTITPYTLSVTANAQSKTYGAADPALTYTNGALQNGDTAAVFSGALTRVAGENVGAYAISQGTLSAGSNYTISYTGANLTVTPYALSVTANAQGKTYGAADPALTYTNGALQNGDTAAVFTGGLTRVAGENVGAYAISQGTLSAGANYTISYTGANLTVTPYALTVTADTQGKVYGAADPALTYTNGALQNGDTVAVFSGALTRVAGENVGAYAISQGTLSAGSNYTISYAGANLNITPYLLTVTANAQGKTYGAADPALTYANGALQNGDTAAVFTGGLTRAVGENVGAYAIGQGTLSAGANYTISYTGANLTITPYALTVTADAQGKTYGAADPALTYANGALQNGDTATVFTGGLTRAVGENVGAYAIGQGTLSAGANYTISYTGANLTITPYALSVTANAQGKTYGAADPALTYTNGALQNGDTAAVFSGGLTRAAGENVGAYAIGQGTLSAGGNYTITYTGANLTITPYALSVTADAQSKTYGAADPALTYTSGALQNGDTAAVFSGTQTRVAGENVGSYAISQGTLSAGSNYTITYTGGNLSITPYALTVTADAQGKTYGAADPALTYTYGALQNGDTAAVLSGALTRAVGENVGAYAIGQGTVSAGANYTISYTGATLTITPYALTVTADAQGKTYGAADPALTYTNGALQNGDTAAVFSGSLTRAAGENVGAYAIGQGTLSAGGNYTISYTGANLTITPYALTVTADAQGKTYGAADPALTYTYGALQNGDTAAVFTGAQTRVAGENVGVYAISQGTLSAGSNYTVTYTGANLTITPYALSVTADALGKVYGAADPALTYTYGTLQNGDTAAIFSGAQTRVAGENVGAYAISQGTLAATANYTITYTGANLTITPYALTVTADAQGKTYGAADPALTYTYGALQNGDTAAVLSGALTRAVGENVGAYAIGQGTVSAGANYTISYTGANLTITPYALSVLADAQTKVYGAADPALTYTYGALQNGDTAAVFGGALTRAAGQNVGAYAIGQGTLTAGGNYTITYTGANLSITPYALNVTANALGKVYGAADPALSYTYGALQNGDTAAVFTGAQTRAAGQNVGLYAISQGTLAAGGNYTVTYTGNTFTITPAALSIRAQNQIKTFGNVFTFTGTEFTTLGLVAGDSVTGATITSLGAPGGAAAGAYTITASGAVGVGLANYTVSYIDGTMTVLANGMIIPPTVVMKVQGEADDDEPDTTNINLNTGSLGDAWLMDSSDLISMDPALAGQLGLTKKMKPEKRSGL